MTEEFEALLERRLATENGDWLMLALLAEIRDLLQSILDSLLEGDET